MKFEGPLTKMDTMYENPVQYALDLGDDVLVINRLIGRQLGLKFNGRYTCFCGLDVAKVFRANFCYECYMTKPEAGEAIFRPELSKAHLGIADRDLAFEQRYQMQPHVVYLANSGGLKVGVTRARQKATRWMDQGATSAIVLAETENRFQAGELEVFLKNHLSDKTHWQRMLTNALEDIDLVTEKHRVAKLLPAPWQALVSSTDEVFHFVYPVALFPQKVLSLSLAKTPEFVGKLTGIKGQYLIFESGHVLNVRSHEGFQVVLDVV